MRELKTSGQKWFEEFIPILLRILAGLTDDQRKQVFEYVIRLHNFNTNEN